MKFPTIFLFAALVLPLAAMPGPTPPGQPWFDGGDLSALGRIEELGGTFRTAEGEPTDALRALAAAGANCVRLRLFVTPDGRGFRVNDLPYTLALAKRAKAAGQAILLDFHYSDTWADPHKQAPPDRGRGTRSRASPESSKATPLKRCTGSRRSRCFPNSCRSAMRSRTGRCGRWGASG